jgi:hypothetical protein
LSELWQWNISLLLTVYLPLRQQPKVTIAMTIVSQLTLIARIQESTSKRGEHVICLSITPEGHSPINQTVLFDASGVTTTVGHNSFKETQGGIQLCHIYL